MIDRDAAASALASIETARRRSTVLRGYARGGDIVIAWGLVWLIANIAAWTRPELGSTVWLVGVTLAAAFSALRGRGQRGSFDWRPLATVATALCLLFAVQLLLGRGDAAVDNVVAVLFVAASYVVLGIWAGARFAWLGILLAALALTAWRFDPGAIRLWLGIGGGGALILSGLWLRRA